MNAPLNKIDIAVDVLEFLSTSARVRPFAIN